MSIVTDTPHTASLDGMARRSDHSIPADAMRLPLAQASRAIYLAGGITVLLAAIGMVGASFSWRQFAFSYLATFMFGVSIALGSMAWVFMHHLSWARWSVVVRRLFENLSMCVLVLAILFLPIPLSVTSPYGWTDADANGDHPLWQAKHAYL